MSESIDKDASVRADGPAAHDRTDPATHSLTDPDQWVDRHGDALDRVPLGSQHFEKVFNGRGAWRTRPGAWPNSSANDAAGVFHKREFWEVFQRCLDGLPQRLRTIFSLREMDERTTTELCEALQLSPGHVAVLLYRARMGLRACLEDHWFRSDAEEA